MEQPILLYGVDQYIRRPRLRTFVVAGPNGLEIWTDDRVGGANNAIGNADLGGDSGVGAQEQEPEVSLIGDFPTAVGDVSDGDGAAALSADDDEDEDAFASSEDETPEQEQGFEVSLNGDSPIAVGDVSDGDGAAALSADDDEDEVAFASSEDETLTYLPQPLLVHLLTIYTSDLAGEDDITKHTFHYKGTNHEDVRQYFNDTFPDGAFTVDGIPTQEGIRRVVSVLQPKLNRVSLEFERLEKGKKMLTTRINNAHKHEKELKKFLEGPRAHDMRNLNRAFNSQANRHLSAEGGDTNAQLTPGSMAKIATVLKDDFNICSDDIIADGGCSFNTFCCYMAIEFDCRVFGIEYIVNRQYLGSHSYLMYHKWAGEATNLRIGFIPTNMFKMDSFLSASVVYLFDEVSACGPIHTNIAGTVQSFQAQRFLFPLPAGIPRSSL